MIKRQSHKKTYKSPLLRVYGDIRELTLTVAMDSAAADAKLGKNTKTA